MALSSNIGSVRLAKPRVACRSEFVSIGRTLVWLLEPSVAVRQLPPLTGALVTVIVVHFVIGKWGRIDAGCSRP